MTRFVIPVVVFAVLVVFLAIGLNLNPLVFATIYRSDKMQSRGNIDHIRDEAEPNCCSIPNPVYEINPNTDKP